MFLLSLLIAIRIDFATTSFARRLELSSDHALPSRSFKTTQPAEQYLLQGRLRSRLKDAKGVIN